MTDAQRCTLENLALALTSYAERVEKDAELRRIFDRISVPGGKSIMEFAADARFLSAKHPRHREYEGAL
jgi:hypothetical protein